MQSIETYYKGYHFRSRLEARWAVFFDALGVDYEYEPEGFVLDNDLKYLPDFRIRCYGYRQLYNRENPTELYIEVKGTATRADFEKVWELSKYKDILVLGQIPEVRECCLEHLFLDCFESYVPGPDGSKSGLCQFSFEYIDGDSYTAIPMVSKSGQLFLAGGDYDWDKDVSYIQTVMAYSMAREARFEHGETPFSKKERYECYKKIEEERFKQL